MIHEAYSLALRGRRGHTMIRRLVFASFRLRETLRPTRLTAETRKGLRALTHASDADFRRILADHSAVLRLFQSESARLGTNRRVELLREIRFDEYLALERGRILTMPLMGNYMQAIFWLFSQCERPPTTLYVLRRRAVDDHLSGIFAAGQRLGITVETVVAERGEAEQAPLRRLHRILRSGGTVVIPFDHGPRYGRSRSATLNGIPLRITDGVAALSWRTGALILPFVSRLLEWGDELEFFRPLDPLETRWPSEAGYVDAAMGALVRVLEREVVRHPAQWHQLGNLGEYLS